MRLTQEQYDAITQESSAPESTISAKAIEYNSQGTRMWGLWPKSKSGIIVVPIKFASNIPQNVKDAILTWAQKWEVNASTGLKTKVDFVLHSNQKYFLYVAFANCGMSATLGFSSGQYQDSCRPGYGNGHLNLPYELANRISEAWVPSAIQHELGHVLGFVHEHMRADRDNYIKVRFENIKTEEHIHWKSLANVKPVAGTSGYDYHSVMHYTSYAIYGDCSKVKDAYGNDVQLFTLANGEAIDVRCSHVSTGDYEALKMLYSL